MTLHLTLLHLLVASANPFERAYDVEIAAAVTAVEPVHHVPRELVRAIIRCESDFNPKAFSKAGAIGLMQVMPSTAARVGFTASELWEPPKNILAGTRLLAVLLRYYRGDLISVLVAYNARPRKMSAPIPRNGETPRYVAAVLKYYRTYLRTPPSPGEVHRPH